MGIRLDEEKTVDGQGLPVLTWEEDRNLFAPDGFGSARVACFIRPDANGVLQFVSVGNVRHGEYEEARPWEALRSFRVSRADEHYYSAGEKARIEWLASRSKSGVGKWLATDGAHVIEARFSDDRPGISMHLNCAEARVTDITSLHDRLTRDFVTRKDHFLYQLGLAEFKWHEGRAPFVAFALPAPTPRSRWLVRAADLTIVAVLGLIGLGLYWLLGR